VGKSTIAQRYVDAHPGALNLDIDRVRRMIGGWRDDPSSAGRAARALALAAAETHLATGHDVVVPQYLRPDVRAGHRPPAVATARRPDERDGISEPEAGAIRRDREGSGGERVPG
jgi:predicted kinase